MTKTTIINFNSSQYHEARSFRAKILREPLGLEYTNDDFENDKKDIHIIITINDVINGTLQLTELDKDTYKMRQVSIALDKQGIGLGKKLVLASEELAIKNDKNLITLNARTSAKTFYEKIGYTSVGEEFLEVGIPHTKMEKRLK